VNMLSVAPVHPGRRAKSLLATPGVMVNQLIGLCAHVTMNVVTVHQPVAKLMNSVGR
jgi:hypothetical protein